MRKIFTKVPSVAVALGLVVACVGLGTPPKALAAASACTAGNFCLWTSDNYTGSIYFVSQSMGVGGCVNLPYPTYDDQINSLYNNTLSRAYTIYEGYNCPSGSGGYTILHGQKFGTLSGLIGNNTMSSVRRTI